MEKRKTHEKFISQVLSNSPNYFNDCELVDKYISAHTHLTLLTDFGGICKIHPSNIILGLKPSLKNTVDKVDYLTKELKVKLDKFKYKILKVDKKSIVYVQTPLSVYRINVDRLRRFDTFKP